MCLSLRKTLSGPVGFKYSIHSILLGDIRIFLRIFIRMRLLNPTGNGCHQARKLKEMEKENTQLKKLVADLSLDNAILKEVLGKK